jgi:hypothetical protein
MPRMKGTGRDLERAMHRLGESREQRDSVAPILEGQR